jgi:hypothetical protein
MCKHEFVNTGFTSITMACKYCGMLEKDNTFKTPSLCEYVREQIILDQYKKLLEQQIYYIRVIPPIQDSQVFEVYHTRK